MTLDADPHAGATAYLMGTAASVTSEPDLPINLRRLAG